MHADIVQRSAHYCAGLLPIYEKFTLPLNAQEEVLVVPIYS